MLPTLAHVATSVSVDVHHASTTSAVSFADATRP
jgi:hypothetical protein